MWKNVVLLTAAVLSLTLVLTLLLGTYFAVASIGFNPGM